MDAEAKHSSRVRGIGNGIGILSFKKMGSTLGTETMRICT